MRDEIRLLGGAALLGGWLALFFLGLTAGGLIHLLPVAALILVPWRGKRDRQADPATTPKEKP